MNSKKEETIGYERNNNKIVFKIQYKEGRKKERKPTKKIGAKGVY